MTRLDADGLVIQPIAWTPHKGQKKAIKFLIEHAASAIFADPGVGKTTIALGAFKVLQKQGVASKALIVAPLKPCYLVWPYEVAKWQDFAHLRVEVLHGPKKDAALARDADIYVINPEGLEWLIGAEWTRGPRGGKVLTFDKRRFKALGFDTLILDELSKWKHHNTARFKALRSVRDTFARIWGLTGSPAPNGLMDLFGQCLMLDGGRTLGQFITHFRQQFFIPGYDGFSWDLKAGAEEAIYARLDPLVLRLAAADYVDMPDLVDVVHAFDLPPAARRVYDDLEDDLLALIEGGAVTAANAGVASMKCRQVASGGLYLEDAGAAPVGKAPVRRAAGRPWALLHDEKTDLLAELVDELQGHPLLVAYAFAHDLERLRARFGVDLPYLGAGVSPKRAAEVERAWNAGRLPLLAVHPASAGHGLNLQGSGSHVCWYTMTWDYEQDDQTIRRIWRQGHKGARVFVHRLVARGTVDEKLIVVLASKQRGQQALFDALGGKNRRLQKPGGGRKAKVR